MDLIQRAIDSKKHISKREDISIQSWKTFEKVSSDKKIYLFGAGACAGYVIDHYQDIAIEGIIDNDMNKQGFRLDDFVDEARETNYGRLMIGSIEELKHRSPDELVVLIANINFYEQIIDELEKIGINNYFVVHIMEANKRIENPDEIEPIEEFSHEEYALRCSKKKIVENKIFFYSFGTYSDHGKYISEALLRLNADVDLVWLVNDLRTEVPRGVRKVLARNWKRCIYEMETAKIWIYNMVVPRYAVKRPEQIYIQTKHWASVTLKRFYLDSLTIQNVSDDVDNWKYNSEIMDYIITGSDFDTASSRRGFGFQKEILQIGSPRSDALFVAEKNKDKVYHYFHIDQDIRLLIYAPTYRFNKSSNTNQHESREVKIDFEMLKQSLEKRFGGIWYIMLRLHPSVASEGEKMSSFDFVINASDYEDSEELVAASEIMISDYSSIMFEPAFVKKPVFLFATDKQEYIDKEYDLLLDYDTLPFTIAATNEELSKQIECFDVTEYENRLSAFMEKHGVHEDGHASERAAQFILNLINKGE